eukprot:m.229427 g.229427  ORF g.229427 m.229427 type:complete len:291 (+) comp15988_c0_seq19:168-1040(+)
MKFKGKITTTSGIQSLLRLVTTYSKLCKEKKNTHLRLTPEKWHLASVGDTDGNISVWTDVRQDSVFATYNIESTHQNNEILVSLHLDFLIRAIKSASTSSEVTVKLSKRGDARYISFHIMILRPNGTMRPIVQDVPLELCPHADIESVVCPDLPMPEVNIYLPPLRSLKSVIERMKAMSETATIATNRAGELQLKIDTTIVSVKTHFKNLENPAWGDDGEPVSGVAPTDSHDDSQFVEVCVGLKHLHQFLHAHIVPPHDILMSVAKNTAIILFVAQDDTSLTCYIPTRSL